jgi:23S rRNA-/tRNA-specific pseudouridylate synthase
MAHIGHPLIGDKRYGGPNVVKFPELEHLHGRKGHLLNAQEIKFFDSQEKIHDIRSQKGISEI